MPPREALVVEARGERFRFYFDLEQPEVLHITLRHGTTPRDAIQAFFVGQTTWNASRCRFEALTETHGVYWARHPRDESVIVITCFIREATR